MKKHITKLKNLFLNSVDLCKVGANQKAHICLTKNLSEKEGEELNTLENLSLSIAKAFDIKESEENVSKLMNTISESLFKNEEEKIKMSMAESIRSIMDDTDIEAKQKSEILGKSVSEFFSAVVDFAEENIDITKTQKNSKGEVNSMIDVNKMTQDDKKIYENLMKKYVFKDESKEPLTEDMYLNLEAKKSSENINSELNPEVKKALDEVQKKMSELEEMKKSYEIKEMEIVAKKYEIIGHKPEELAEKLYEYKKSDGTIYNDYIALLDEQLAMTKSVGIFDEIGSSRSGNAVEKQLEEKIQEIMKSNTNITYEQAFVKACDENDELRKAFV